MNIKLRIADIGISINTGTSFAKHAVRYEDKTDGGTDICVDVTDDELRKRSERFPEIGERGIESYLIYEKICDELPRFDAFMLHAAVLEYDGKAYAFCARSGTGKSTHARLWHNMLGDRCRYINGDKPIIRIINGVPTAFGTPWNGKENLGDNIFAPLAGVCFLVRSENPYVRRLDKNECLFRFLAAAHCPKDHSLDEAFYKSIGNVVDNVPMYELLCDISENAAKLSFQSMTGEKI